MFLPLTIQFKKWHKMIYNKILQTVCQYILVENIINYSGKLEQDFYKGSIWEIHSSTLISEINTVFTLHD